MTGYMTDTKKGFTEEQLKNMVDRIAEISKPTKAIFYSTGSQKKAIEDGFRILLDSDDCTRIGLRFVRTNQIPSSAIFVMDI